MSSAHHDSMFGSGSGLASGDIADSPRATHTLWSHPTAPGDLPPGVEADDLLHELRQAIDSLPPTTPIPQTVAKLKDLFHSLISYVLGDDGEVGPVALRPGGPHWHHHSPKSIAVQRPASTVPCPVRHTHEVATVALRPSDRPSERTNGEALIELLQRFTHVENGQLYAHCYLLVLNRSPYSEVQIARLLKVTKQAVSKVKRWIQVQLGMKPRVGRSEPSCQKFREICLARSARKKASQKPGLLWPAARSFFKGSAPRAARRGTQSS